VMLGLRLAEGMPAAQVDDAIVADLVDEGMLVRRDDRVVLTYPGRLLADAVVRRLLE
jgi:hypothetical protein